MRRPFVLRLSLMVLVSTLMAAPAAAQPSEADAYDMCLVALSESAKDALTVNGTASVNMPGCGVVVNSDSNSAIRMTGSSELNAKYVEVVGGASTTGQATINPLPTPAETPLFPLTFLNPPTFDSCDYTDFEVTGAGSTTLNPGTYCNGITVKNSAQAIFNPGTYVLLGGGLNASGNSELIGDGVTFFFTEGQGYSYGPLIVRGSAKLDLSAPPSGPFYGILFYQDLLVQHPAENSLSGSTESVLEGIAYFGTSAFQWAGNADASQSNYFIIVADTISLTGTATIGANFPNGRPPLMPPLEISINPSVTSVRAEHSKQFNAVLQYAIDPSVTWSISPSGRGAITSEGLYTAPADVASEEPITITVTSVEDPAKSATAMVTLLPPISVNTAPGLSTLYANQTQQFTAQVINTSNQGVLWNVTPAGFGTIDVNGLFTAPSSITAQAQVSVIATSLEDPNKFGVSTVNLMPPVAVSVSPPATTLIGGASQVFTETVSNAINPSVVWAVASGPGTIDGSGVYTAPAVVPSPATATVTATSVQDPSKFASATITLQPVQISLAPQTATLIPGATQQFSPTVSNASTADVTWTLNPPGQGSVDGSGLYTAPSVIPSETSVTITATSVADPAKSSSATVSLLPVTISVSPSTKTLFVNQQQALSATVENASNTSVTWSVDPSGVGSISAAGVYTAPASISDQQTVTITATSAADPNKSASAVFTLMPVTVSLSPATSTLFVGQTKQFTAMVTNADDTSVTWFLNAGASGSIDSTGLYTAPASIVSEETVTVTATSVADPSKSTTSTVTLEPVIVSVGPSGTTLEASQTQQFTANVTNAADTSVTWSISPSVGTIDQTGLYTAPSVTKQEVITVTATSNADSTKTGTATMTLLLSTITLGPQTVSLQIGGTVQFTASVSEIDWSISPAGVGSISTSGLYTAPASLSDQVTVTVTATSQVNPAVSASSSITLDPVQVSLTPDSESIVAGQTQQFTATVTNTPNTDVTWSVTPTGGGSISATGLYTPPATIPTQQVVQVIATSVADPVQSASANVTLVPATLSVSPAEVTLHTLQPQQFTATVTNTADQSVTWSIAPALGSIDSSGLYTPPSNPCPDMY